MKWFLIVIALLVSAATDVSVQVPARANDGDVQHEFETLLERVRTSDESVDFTRLRTLYAEGKSYAAPRDDEGEMIDLAVNARCAEARDKARAILARSYTITRTPSHGLAVAGIVDRRDLVRRDDGKMYDVPKVRNASTGRETSAIVNVDAPATGRLLGLK